METRKSKQYPLKKQQLLTSILCSVQAHHKLNSVYFTGVESLHWGDPLMKRLGLSAYWLA